MYLNSKDINNTIAIAKGLTVTLDVFKLQKDGEYIAKIYD